MLRATIKHPPAPVRLPATAALDLHAGPVQLRFEPARLWARHWFCGGVEVLRAVYPAIRDAGWNTLEPRIRWRQRELRADRFTLELTARYGGRQPFFEWNLRLEGARDGTVIYAARGVALRTFQSNRAGFCILHPAGEAGRRCHIEHSDGTSEKGVFPREISPHQPFLDIRAIAHSPAPGLRVEVRMDGEVFEMEDQRNWTDASFKTYCRPLERPRPFAVRRGETIEQRIEVRVSTVGPQLRRDPMRERRESSARMSAAVPALTRRAAGRVLTTAECVLTLDRKRVRMPAIGVQRGEDTPLSAIAATLLRTARIKHLRVDLDATAAKCLAQWTRAITDVAKLGAGVSLEVVLQIGANGRGLEKLARHIAANPAPPATRWLVLDAETGVSSTAAVDRVATLWLHHRINGALGGGVGGDFVDFNRARPLVPGIEFVGFGVDAQVHAFDEISILETLSTYPTVVAQARRISGGLPIAISPVRFGMPRTDQRHREDPRLRTAFGAVWILASLAALTRAKVESATFHFPRLDRPTPALRVLQACASTTPPQNRSRERERVDRAFLLASTQPRHACGLALRTPAGLRVLLANLRRETQRMRPQGLPRGDRRVTLLSSEGPTLLSRGMSANTALTLPPYAVVQIDISSGT